MCEVSVYINKEGKEKLFLKDVDLIRPQKEELFIKNIFGEQKTIKGHIKEINMLKHKIIIE
jgi:predicted RNA-binding protein